LATGFVQPGNVYYNFVLRDPSGWFDDPSDATRAPLEASSVYFFKGWDHPGIVSEYHVTDTEADDLSEFLAASWDSWVRKNRAFGLFFRGYHEPYADDRLLRNAIALENLLVNDTRDQSNIRYKFVDRAAVHSHWHGLCRG
jgi:hypothetical protein